MAETGNIPIGRTGKPLRLTHVRNQHRVTHGATIGKVIPPEYNSWKGMRHRCTLPSNPKWPLYGGRGITVCERWQKSFADFIADVGPKPGLGYSLDRIDTDGNYEPGNVRWATQKAQCRNQRRNRVVVYDAVERTLAEVAEIAGVESSHLAYYLNQGYTADDAVAAVLSNRRKPANECVNGHLKEGNNAYVSPNGHTQCRICRNAAKARMKAKA